MEGLEGSKFLLWAENIQMTNGSPPLPLISLFQGLEQGLKCFFLSSYLHKADRRTMPPYLGPFSFLSFIPRFIFLIPMSPQVVRGV